MVFLGEGQSGHLVRETILFLEKNTSSIFKPELPKTFSLIVTVYLFFLVFRDCVLPLVLLSLPCCPPEDIAPKSSPFYLCHQLFLLSDISTTFPYDKILNMYLIKNNLEFNVTSLNDFQSPFSSCSVSQLTSIQLLSFLFKSSTFQHILINSQNCLHSLKLPINSSKVWSFLLNMSAWIISSLP